MTLTQYLRVLRHQWLVVVLLTLLGFGGAAAYTYRQTPVYSAQTQLFVSVQSRDVGIATLSQGSTFTQQRVKSYADIVTSPMIAQAVISDLRLPFTPEQLVSKISATTPLDTVLLDISVTDTDPARAAAIADAVGAEFPRLINRLETPNGSTRSPVLISPTRGATVPAAPIAPRVPLNLALGLILGLGLGIGAAVLRDQFNTTVSGIGDLEKLTGSIPLGVVPFDSAATKHPLVTADQAGGRAEAFKTLRTNLQFADVDDPPRVIAVSSSLPAEGKTTTACNTALTLAQSGARVILVEGDLRKPAVGKYLGISNAAGLTNVLAGQHHLMDVIVGYQRNTLAVLPSGPTPPNPSEMLGSQQMRQLLAVLAAEYDVVIIDAPPLLPVTDAAVLAAAADGVIMVVRHGRSRREEVERALQALDSVNAKVLGTVLNFAPRSKGRGGYDGYGYGYGYGQAAPQIATIAEKVPQRSSRRERKRARAAVTAAQNSVFDSMPATAAGPTGSSPGRVPGPVDAGRPDAQMPSLLPTSTPIPAASIPAAPAPMPAAPAGTSVVNRHPGPGRPAPQHGRPPAYPQSADAGPSGQDPGAGFPPAAARPSYGAAQEAGASPFAQPPASPPLPPLPSPAQPPREAEPGRPGQPGQAGQPSQAGQPARQYVAQPQVPQRRPGSDVSGWPVPPPQPGQPGQLANGQPGQPWNGQPGQPGQPANGQPVNGQYGHYPAAAYGQDGALDAQYEQDQAGAERPVAPWMPPGQPGQPGQPGARATGQPQPGQYQQGQVQQGQVQQPGPFPPQPGPFREPSFPQRTDRPAAPFQPPVTQLPGQPPTRSDQPSPFPAPGRPTPAQAAHAAAQEQYSRSPLSAPFPAPTPIPPAQPTRPQPAQPPAFPGPAPAPIGRPGLQAQPGQPNYQNQPNYQGQPLTPGHPVSNQASPAQPSPAARPVTRSAAPGTPPPAAVLWAPPGASSATGERATPGERQSVRVPDEAPSLLDLSDRPDRPDPDEAPKDPRSPRARRWL